MKTNFVSVNHIKLFLILAKGTTEYELKRNTEGTWYLIISFEAICAFIKEFLWFRWIAFAVVTYWSAVREAGV